jgi:ATP/maltotriose-dependent transcriptional regulator MalT
VAIIESIDFPPPATPYDADVVTWAHITHAMALAALGRPDQAMRAAQLADVRARGIDHGYSLVTMSATRAVLGFIMDDPELSWSGAEEARALAEGRGYTTVEQLAWIYPGWARASLGEVDEGVRDVEKGLSLGEATGMTWVFDYMAPAHVYRMVGRMDRAEELLDRATAEYQRTEQWAYHSRACLARAQVLLELEDGTPTEAEDLLLEAVESAGSVDDLHMELVASTHLARLAPRTGKVREAHDRLAGHYARLTEGFDRRPAREAKAALDELAARLDGESPES